MAQTQTGVSNQKRCTITGVMTAAISTAYVCVKRDTSNSGQWVISGAGERVDGVLQEVVSNAGDPANVAIDGTAKLKLGSGGATVGDRLKSDANGYGVTATADDVEIVGIAATTGAENDIIEIDVRPGTISGSEDD